MTARPNSRTAPALRRGAVIRPRVLVIYKKSAYQVYVRERRHPRVSALLRAGDRAASRLRRAHHSHETTLELAREALRKLGARAVFRHRSVQGAAPAFDLIVTIGGDGTLLRASQLVGADCPVVAINSAPDDSVGHFCAGSRVDVAEVLAASLQGDLPVTRLSRMQVALDGKLVSSRVLNDILFCHVSPAATTRYALRFRGRSEEHKSSGLWVATAAGSTAAILSAGGKPLPIGSRKLEFLVREPYRLGRAQPRLLRGLIRPGEALSVRSQVRAGCLYVDGPRVFRPVPIGATLEFSSSPEPLSLLGFRGGRR